MPTPYAKNAKKHPDAQLKQIALSLKEYGWRQPIVTDKNDEIIVGHGRWIAYQKYPEGIKEPWIEKATDLTPEQVKGYRLMDNKTNESDWDMALAIEELKELDSLGFDIELTGFDKDLLIEPDEKDDLIPTDVPTRAKLGDVWLLGEHRVVCGDSTDKDAVARLMDGKKADMVFTDPPYGIDFQSNFREKTPQFSKIANDAEILDISPILREQTKGESVSYICTRWDVYPQWVATLSDFNIKNCVVWYKRGGGLGDLKHSYSPNHEFIIVAHRGAVELQEKRHPDVWEMKRDSFNSYQHPTQKPVELPSFAMRNHSKQDDTVLDLFLGSGSTLIAAEKTGRICYGMELDPRYVDVILKRWEDYTNKIAIKTV